MKKFIKTLSLILTLSVSAIAVAQTPPPATPTCPALERLNAGTAKTRDCSTLTGKAKCRCEARNVRILAMYELRKVEAQQRCDNRVVRQTIRDTEKTTRNACTD